MKQEKNFKEYQGRWLTEKWREFMLKIGNYLVCVSEEKKSVFKMWQPSDMPILSP